MKILQLNIWGGRLFKQITDLIEKEQPDIICLQETYSGEGGDYGFLETMEEVQEVVPGYELFFSKLYTVALMRRQVSFGNSILSKYPYQKKETVFTSGEFTENFDFKTHNYNIRNFQHAIIDTPDGPIHILNHHGYHIEGHKNGNSETLKQTKLIADYANGLEGKVVLTGDFNLAPRSASLEQVNAALRNLCIENSVETTRTFLTHKKEVCDYIFVNDQIKVSDFSVLNDLASDHCALVAIIN